ncbi:P-loop containing nucleoside triphosphate hydrolases superfamily protein isoform X2 [Wolffia australiana]
MCSAGIQCRMALSVPPQSSINVASNRRDLALAVHRCGRRRSLICRAEATAVSALEDGFVVVEDDIHALLEILPKDVQEKLRNEPRRAQLLEVVLDLGRRPEARFLGESGGQYLREREITLDELEEAQNSVGEFGDDNRAGIEGTLHRISAIRSRKGLVVGMTCRVGRAVTGHVDMIRDLLNLNESILFLGRPGVGKTTVMREIAHVLADELHKRVVIVDTSNEIGGDGDVPHPAIGGARRMQVPRPSLQHRVMIEAVENHMPEVVIVDEIGTEAEAMACRSIAERGVVLIGTAHGEQLGNIIKNPTLTDLGRGRHDFFVPGRKNRPVLGYGRISGRKILPGTTRRDGYRPGTKNRRSGGLGRWTDESERKTAGFTSDG